MDETDWGGFITLAWNASPAFAIMSMVMFATVLWGMAFIINQIVKSIWYSIHRD
ncbi:hypothetical protein [Vibrio sinensis]|uniref:hypothetical protein n=1 Tax=Vibrio sinensis TaxID=2302434 RepID=UPI0014041F64|nr:hypothetical protein [Vibrio sinensis]